MDIPEALFYPLLSSGRPFPFRPGIPPLILVIWAWIARISVCNCDCLSRILMKMKLRTELGDVLSSEVGSVVSTSARCFGFDSKDLALERLVSSLSDPIISDNGSDPNNCDNDWPCFFTLCWKSNLMFVCCSSCSSCSYPRSSFLARAAPSAFLETRCPSLSPKVGLAGFSHHSQYAPRFPSLSPSMISTNAIMFHSAL